MRTSRTRTAVTVAVVLALVGLALAGCALFEPPRPPLTFSPTELPAAFLGVTYEATITVGGNVTPVGSISTTPSALPPGLRLIHERGQNVATITGTPTGTAGRRYPFTVSAWCLGTNVNGQAGSHAYEIGVATH